MLMDVARYPRDQHQDQPLRVLRLLSRRNGGIDCVDIQERVQGRQQVLRRIPGHTDGVCADPKVGQASQGRCADGSPGGGS